MTELGEIFAELGISRYLDEFIEQGFDTWDTILDITESDFDALGVKLGHRRKLQRKIANSRGISSDRALDSPRHTPTEERSLEEQKVGGTKVDVREGNGATHGAKRKYRRHPKPDEHAPERPPSAYVIFSNKMREELKGRNLSFTEIAKLVGENWQNLAPSEKEPFEQQASSAKEKYNNELVEYKKTNSYKEYSQYLAEFKARHSNQQQVSDLEVVKRPKLEAKSSTESNVTTSSGVSQHGGDIALGRSRAESSASSTTPWLASDGNGNTSASMPQPNFALGGPNSQSPPNTTSPNILPGYRESIYGGGAQQSLPWRDGHRDDSSTSLPQLPRLTNISDRRPSFPALSRAEVLNLTGSSQHIHRTGQLQGHAPPLLTSESTNRSTASSTSTISSPMYTPHTPLEPALERALPIPSLYPQKASGSYENQLLPLGPPSISPQLSSSVSQHSPNSIPTFLPEYPSSMAPMRGFTATAPQKLGQGERQALSTYDLASRSAVDDNDLDPVSALLKAGEIVSRNSRNQQGP
ncbi:High mobility group protein 20A [Lachnellula suecica]|uniref:High mobility group protein 20A n=1 Tax=Lachnellula suecica TaxID=602035 RepID=A0A8T9C2H8_9HELO|nr:High mobility group protein 20A [Lachnellula suecica]